jgi:hypothetical protein
VDQQPGVLTLNLVAVLTNNGPAWVLTNRVRFEADDIGSAQKVWSADNPDGRPVANGAELTATLYYVHLPANNSDFGLKMARVKLDGAVHDEKCFWAFYPADAFNYPGCPPWSASLTNHPMFNEMDEETRARYDPYRPPNYFYYYKQTAAYYDAGGNGPAYYRARSYQERPVNPPGYQLPEGEVHPCGPWRCFVESAKDRSGKPIPEPGVNGGQWLTYIDIFAWACRHEVRHVQNYGAWWPQCYDAQNDPDTDNIPSAVELTLAYNGIPYSPTNACTHGYYCGPGAGDDQLYTCLTAQEWEPLDTPEGDPHDWAKPGKNWPE